jgi:hypothetical protein
MKKVLIVAFGGEATCYAHALLNALDMKERGYDVLLLIEGAATKLVAEQEKTSAPFHDLWQKVKEAGIVEAVCRACATKMGSIRAAQKLSLSVSGEMSGHPALAPYLEQGYQIITI